MNYPKFVKRRADQFSVKPNLIDYDRIYEAFSWDELSQTLDSELWSLESFEPPLWELHV